VPKALLTLAVDQAAAQKLVYARDHGATLTFGLLTDKSEIDKSATGTTERNLFD
jgi:hypothetical protein